MPTIKLNNVTALTESGGTVSLDSGVTGGSGLDTISAVKQGGSIIEYTYSGTSYRVHIFRSSDNFITVSAVTVDVLVIGGGGGGGNGYGGGGGSGGLVWSTGISARSSGDVRVNF